MLYLLFIFKNRRMYFQKQDLTGTHYQPLDINTHLFTGQPSRRVFNRFNSSQVLFIINSCGDWLDRFTREDGQAIEQQIATLLPEGARSEISVFNWIRSSAANATPQIF
jgi:hypothetical protein